MDWKSSQSKPDGVRDPGRGLAIRSDQPIGVVDKGMVQDGGTPCNDQNRTGKRGLP